MCTLALFYKLFPGSPAVLLSNRDEMGNRPWEGPSFIRENPRVFGPRDVQGGGTWLGVNEHGVLVTITNHFGTLSNGDSMCTRGTVVTEALIHASALESKEAVTALCPLCKSFTLLIADRERAFVVDHAGGVDTRTYELGPGLHVVTNDRFKAHGDVKAARVRRGMEEIARRGEPGLDEARLLLGDHVKEEGQLTPLCTHPREGWNFGTVSSAVVKLDEEGGVSLFAFAPGPPCVTPYRDVTPRA